MSDRAVTAVTRFQDAAGGLWETEAAAVLRNHDLDRADLIMGRLRPRPGLTGAHFENGYGHIQQDLAAVRAVRADLLVWTEEHLVGWLDSQRMMLVDLSTSHPRWFHRQLGDRCLPLKECWLRLWMIDESGREWGRPRYADNIEEARDRNPLVA